MNIVKNLYFILLLPNLLLAIGMPTVQDILSIGDKVKKINLNLTKELKNSKKTIAEQNANIPYRLTPFDIPNTPYSFNIPSNWKKQVPQNNETIGIFAPTLSFYPSLIIMDKSSSGMTLTQFHKSWIIQHQQSHIKTNTFQLLTINNIPISYSDISWQILPNYIARAMILRTLLSPSRMLSITYLNIDKNISAYIRNQYMTSLSSLKITTGTNNAR